MNHTPHPRTLATRLLRTWGSLALAIASQWAVAQSPDTPLEAYLQAMQSLEQGQLDRAEQQLTQVITQHPEWAGAWLDLALLALRRNRYPEAQELLFILEQKFSPMPQAIDNAVQNLQRQIQQELNNPAKAIETITTGNSQTNLAVAMGYDSNANSGLQMSAITLTLPTTQTSLEIDSASRAKSAAYTRLGWAHQDSQAWGTGRITWLLQAQARQNKGLSQFDNLELLPQLTHENKQLPGQIITAWQGVWINAKQVYQAPVLRWQHSQPLQGCEWQNQAQAEERRYSQASHLDSHWLGYKSALQCKSQLQRLKVHIQFANEKAARDSRPGADTRHTNIGLQQEWHNLGGFEQHTLQLKLEWLHSQDTGSYNSLLDNGNPRGLHRTEGHLQWSGPIDHKPEWRWSIGLQINRQKSNIAFFNQRNNALETSIWRAW